MKSFLTNHFLGAALRVALFFSASAEAALYEAEEAVYSSGSVSSDASASGGSYLDGNATFNVTWTVNVETAGMKALFFGIKVPSGDRSMGVFVNDEQVGVVSSSSRAWEEVGVEAPLLAGENTVELRDSEGTAELDVDYLFTSRVKTFIYPAEEMTLSGFTVQSNTVAAGSQMIQLGGGVGSTGTAVQVFGGEAGTYNIDTVFFDESDGVCPFELSIDGVVVDAWVADGDLGGTAASAASLTSRQTVGVELKAGSVIQLQVIRDTGEYGRTDEISLTYVEEYMAEAEVMTLEGYAVESNRVASGGSLVRLTGEKGSLTTTLSDLTAGYYDLTIGYFDETDGQGAFKVFVNDQVVESWLANRMLGASDPASVNQQERLIKKVYLRSGDTLEICGYLDGEESCAIDGYQLKTASESAAVSMDWNADGSIASLVLNSIEQIDSSDASGVIFRIFDGYSVDTLEQYSAEQSGSLVEIHESDLDYARFYFRMDEYEHHVALRLIGVDGIPRGDPSLSIRLEIPYASTLGYQLLDSNVLVSDSGNVLTLDWTQLASRDLLVGGQVALFATDDAAAAQAEIEQVYTDNGTLDAYYTWIGGYALSGTEADLFADPDGDGLPNLTEYALGSAPGQSLDAPALSISMDNEALVYAFPRRTDAAARGLVYTVLATDDLMDPSWTTNGVFEDAVNDLGNGFEAVTNLYSTTDQTNGFLKLEVEFNK